MDKYLYKIGSQLSRKDLDSNILQQTIEECFQELDQESWTESDINNFASIYNLPLIYQNIGIEIKDYLSFYEMLDTKNPMAIDIVVLSFKYKRAQNLYAFLSETLFIADKKRPFLGLLFILKTVFTRFKDKYEKNILESYFSFYQAIQKLHY